MSETKVPFLPQPEEFLEAVKQGQQTALRVVNAFAESVQSASPATLGTLPTREQLTEYVDRAYEVASEVLAAHREFTQALVESAGTAYESATKAVRDATAA
jgi:hypothetical protein